MGSVRFGKYFLIEHIASGGMAEVYKAIVKTKDGESKTVAIKRILPEYSNDDEFITLLVDEAKIMITLAHPNIVSLIEFGKAQDSYFIAFEYLNGINIKELILAARRTGVHIPYHLTAFIFHQAMSGLAYAHSAKDKKGNNLNIVHRDVSPTNLLIGYNGQVKLVDFGIAKASGQGQRTQVGIIRGKSGYMSPEQAWAKKDLDARSDIFSAGIIMYEMLTLTRLFRSNDVAQSIRIIREAEVPAARTRNRNIPEVLEKIVMKSLEKDLSQRYQSSAQMKDDLWQALVEMGKAENAASELSEYLQIIMPEDIADNTEPQIVRTTGKQVVITDRNYQQPQQEIEDIEKMFDDIKPERKEDFEPSLEQLFSEDSITLLANKKYEKQLDFSSSEIPLAAKGLGKKIKKLLEDKQRLFLGSLICFGLIFALYLLFDIFSGPGKYLLHVETDPAGATVVINQFKQQGVTPLIIEKNLVKGKNKISIILTGYQTINKEIILHNRGEHSFYFSLLPQAKLQRILAIYSTPAGATVYINGKLIKGKTPLLLENVDASQSLAVELKLAGYEALVKNINYQEKQRFEKIEAVLIPQKIVNNKPEKPLIIKAKVVAKKPAKRKIPRTTKKVVINRGSGLLNLNSVPFSNVTVKKAGKVVFTGQTPILEQVLPAGQYQALLKTANGQEKKIKFTIYPGKNRKIQTIYFEQQEDDLLSE